MRGLENEKGVILISSRSRVLKLKLNIKTASEDGIKDVKLILNGEEVQTLYPNDNERVLIQEINIDKLNNSDYCYIQTNTADGDMAWSSPFFGEG